MSIQKLEREPTSEEINIGQLEEWAAKGLNRIIAKLRSEGKVVEDPIKVPLDPHEVIAHSIRDSEDPQITRRIALMIDANDEMPGPRIVGSVRKDTPIGDNLISRESTKLIYQMRYDTISKFLIFSPAIVGMYIELRKITGPHFESQEIIGQSFS